MEEVIEYIRYNNLGFLEENRSFKEITTLKVGGKIRLIYYPNSIENFLKFYNFYKKYTWPLLVIGNGSNILASDNEYYGVVVSFKKLSCLFYQINKSFYVFPQCKVSYFAKKIIPLGFCDIEYFAGIPGTIGGLVAMNAGCFGKEIGTYVKEIIALDKTGEIKIFTHDELDFSYRHSFIQDNLIVLVVKMEFPENSDIQKTIQNYQYLQNKRRIAQPINMISAGCAFANPKGYKAWEVIDKLGYRGKVWGGAKVSDKHCNFLVNCGGAKADDFYQLIASIKSDALKKMQIILKNELILINFQ